MRSANEGVALAAIVTKETTDGKWSGSGGGLGFGTGDIGLFVEGSSKREQSQRAKAFEAPPKAFNWSFVFVPVTLLAFVFVVFFGTEFFGGGNAIEGLLDWLGIALPILAIICVVIWFGFGFDRSGVEETARYKAVDLSDHFKEAVYYRLRYVETDHIVFDPDSGREVPAERERILALLNELAAEAATRAKPASLASPGQ